MTIDDLYNLIRRHKHSGIETEKMDQGKDIIPVSFETDEIASPNIYTPFAIRIIRARGRVTKAMAATDDGTVIVKNAAGSTICTLTFTASTAINNDVTAQVAAGNNVIGKDSYYTLTVAKTTAGGKALITIEYERL